MSTKIRLARHGKKGYAFYHIVVADSRSPRDGRFIEKLGTYNPNTNPATVELNFERAVRWIGVGAQPTDTARSILSKEGVMYRHHLNGGVKKGAFTEEVAEQKFAKWVAEKEAKAAQAKAAQDAAKAKTAKERLEAETKVKEAKAAALAAKLAEAAKAAETAAGEDAAEDAAAAEETEAPATEEGAAEEAPAAE
ncbi:MAG: 30S ribosomal protein S16 [Rikenella sp.]|nr:30S ribosomal protein S16 [Rikenella sp.]